jgi:hypothetical protein
MRKLAPAGLKAILQGQTSAAEAAAKGSVCARGKARVGVVALRGLLSQAQQQHDTARLAWVFGGRARLRDPVASQGAGGGGDGWGSRLRAALLGPWLVECPS